MWRNVDRATRDAFLLCCSIIPKMASVRTNSMKLYTWEAKAKTNKAAQMLRSRENKRGSAKEVIRRKRR